MKKHTPTFDHKLTDTSPFAIEAYHLSKVIQTSEGMITLLHGVDLQINKGESLAILGESGSGKTTLLSLLAGLDMPSDGEVLLHGQSLKLMDENARALTRAKYVGFVFQSFHLVGSMTALENVMLPLEIQAKPNAKSRAMALLEQVGLSHRLHQIANRLSGGEQQRVALARAFSCEPAILFADEPTGNLDEKTGNDVAQLMFQMNNHNHTTLVLVTHDKSLASRCERQLLVSQAQVRST